MRSEYRTPPDRLGVVYLGESAALRELCHWGQRHGIDPVDEPDRDSLCAVVDEELLDGPTTESENDVLRQIRRARLPRFTPGHAWPVLSSAVNRGLLAG